MPNWLKHLVVIVLVTVAVFLSFIVGVRTSGEIDASSLIWIAWVAGCLAGVFASWLGWPAAKPTIPEGVRPLAAPVTGVDIIEPEPPPPGPSPTRLDDNQDLLQWFMARRCCPDCGSPEFLKGPRGGLARNVMCADCGQRFNLAPPLLVERLP